MATLREIRRRIAGVRSTAKITQAMKMVAAAKLRRAQDSINAARPYASALEGLLKDLLQVSFARIRAIASSYWPPADETERVVLIVVTSDRGLAGAFNSNLLQFTEARIRDLYSQHRDGRAGFLSSRLAAGQPIIFRNARILLPGNIPEFFPSWSSIPRVRLHCLSQAFTIVERRIMWK